jgi:hypothetical protein
VLEFANVPSACIRKGVGEKSGTAGFSSHPNDPRPWIDFDPPPSFKRIFVVGCDGDAT